MDVEDELPVPTGLHVRNVRCLTRILGIEAYIHFSLLNRAFVFCNRYLSHIKSQTCHAGLADSNRQDGLRWVA